MADANSHRTKPRYETYDTDQPWVIYRYFSTDRETRVTGRSRIMCECAVCGVRKTVPSSRITISLLPEEA